MFNIALYEPEIPPNTGNIMRLCANTGARLHLVEPLGFSLEESQLRRAGLDYREWVEVRTYTNLASLLSTLMGSTIYAYTTKAKRPYADVQYKEGDTFLFGPETRGLPATVLEQFPEERRLRIPLQPENRSLNLSNAAAVVLYEAWRQSGFHGGS